MRLREIGALLEAVILNQNQKLDKDFRYVFGCDLMSDVLSMVTGETVLLTGLTNIQTLRTAEMLDIKCIIFVRGKIPQKDLIDFASDKDICLMTTNKTMFTACGILYNNGLKGVELYSER